MVTRGFFIVIRAQTFFERKFLPAIAPLSLIALLFMTLIIFAAQGHHVVESITDVLRVAAPLLVYFPVMFFGILFLCRHFGVSYPRATTQAFTAASNNFELSTAVAVATWGANSPQALATTVGPLIEYVFPTMRPVSMSFRNHDLMTCSDTQSSRIARTRVRPRLVSAKISLGSRAATTQRRRGSGTWSSSGGSIPCTFYRQGAVVCRIPRDHRA